MKKEYLKKGFTLIELLAVIIILSLFVVFAYPNIINTYRSMKMGTMLVKENDIKNNAKSYISDCLDPTMRYSLSGCNNTNALDTSGYVLLSDMVNDQYAEPVEYENASCEGYISFTEDDYQVCLKCGDRYETDNVNCNFAGQQQPTNTRTEFNFLASGEGQLFTAPTTGKYKVELWGAQGGGDVTNIGGYGGYTSGVITLTAGAKLYVYVGGQGGLNNSRTNIGGINGGGYSGSYENTSSFGGGGSTDLRFFADGIPSSDDLLWNSSKGLASRIMVSAGGAGNSNPHTKFSCTAGYGGGLVGGSAILFEASQDYTPSTGATQVSSGVDYYPNQTTNTISNKSRLGQYGFATQDVTFGFGGGGGGGWYGGVNGFGSGGSGGSSYISGHLGCIGIKSLTDTTSKCTYPTNSSACSVSPTGLRFTNTVMIDGSGYAWTNVKGSLSQMPSKTYGQYYAVGKGNEGNGFARITKLVEGFEEPHTIKLINNNGTVSQSKISLKSTESTAKVTFTQSCPYVTSSSVSCTGGAVGTISGNELTISNVTEITECTITPDPVVVFDEGYTGQIKTFTPSCNGYYKLEAWGAQGQYKGSTVGGRGGYSIGMYEMRKNNPLYIVVGEYKDSSQTGNCVENGDDIICSGGYNGGGRGHGNAVRGAGGGGTHIATVSGLLKDLSAYKDTGGTNISKEILIVAGGGGGWYGGYVFPGSGGGYKGGDTNTRESYGANFGGTQTSAGTSTSYSQNQVFYGGFGYGGNFMGSANGSGAGGGWYGGTSASGLSGSGGSGYIGSSNLLSAKGITKHMYCYNCGETQTNPAYATTVGTCHDDDPTPDCAKEGHGHARITYIGK